MKTVTIPVDIPSDIMIVLNQSAEDLKAHIQTSIAVLLFEEGKLTIGKAIQLSGLSRYEFEKALAKRQIPVVDLNLEQIRGDVEKLEDL